MSPKATWYRQYYVIQRQALAVLKTLTVSWYQGKEVEIRHEPSKRARLKTAALARLDVSAEEVARLGADFARILAAFQDLSDLDVDGVEPMFGPNALRNVLRSDEARPSLDTDQALAAAPDRDGDFFGVPKTLETDP